MIKAQGRTRSLLFVATISDTLRAFFLPFASHFRARGWRVDALARGISTCADCSCAFNRVWNIGWSRNPLSPENLRSRALIDGIVREGDYDIVHVNTPVASFVTRFALRRRTERPRVVYTVHGFHFSEGAPWWKNAIYLNLERLAAPWTDYLVVMNRTDNEMAQRWRLMPPGRVAFIPGVGVNTSYYNPQSVSAESVDAVRHELQLGPRQPLFLMVGEFILRKRQGDALIAFAQMRSANAKLAFAGEGPQFERVKRLAVQLGIEHRTHFLGSRQDISALIRASVATVLPSDREGLPRAVMESLSLGVPVIASDIKGTRMLLEDGRGLLVPVGDTGALAKAMDWVVENPAAGQEMARLGREQMGKYDLQTVLRMYEDLYDCALDFRAVETGWKAAAPMRAGHGPSGRDASHEA